MIKKDEEIKRFLVSKLSNPSQSIKEFNSLFSSVIMKNYYKNNDIDVFVTDNIAGKVSDK